jgi:peptidoglycan/LPS O-acetylase OafA/YrhL
MQRVNGLELTRFLAALAVVYGHLVWSATYDTNLSFYAGPASFPLIPPDTQSLWMFQEAVGNVFHGAHITIIGVALFFLLTGWLTPDLLQRNTRTGYLINRFFRIFPALIISTVVLAFIQKYLHATAPINAKNIFGTITTSYREIGAISLNGVVWTLAIEIRFYILCFCFGTWTCLRLAGAGLLLLIVCNVASHVGSIFLPLAHDSSYMIFILCGVALRRAWDDPSKQLPLATLFFLVFIFNVSRLNGYLFHPTQDFTAMNQGLTYAVFMLCFLTSKWIGNWIQPLAALTYPLYLLHLIIGLATIRLLKAYLGSTGAVFAAVCASFCAAYIFTKLVEVPSIMFGKRVVALSHRP